MSYALKAAATQKYADLADTLRDQLAARGTDTLDQMRLIQGKIAGLVLAAGLLDDAMKELVGEKGKTS